MDRSDYGATVKVTAPPSSVVESFKSITGWLGTPSSDTGGGVRLLDVLKAPGFGFGRR